ncbi:hypothetical protein [Peptostreptococcus stomatis]|uniref:hypothetical protein n=1 Tax=Peptostreptococcus stomatis TaxID=341694 RepID=UPI0028E2E96C|nr:hypothetical protein [Peptostreptococcus stomatis]
MESKSISRVKFYSVNDLSIGSYIERIENIICNFDIEEKRADINEIIELYNIQQFFKNKIYSVHWTDQQLNDYSNIVNSFSKVIGKYFSEINVDFLGGIFDTINYNYRNDFWKLVEKYKVYKNIPVDIFRNIITSKKYILNDILKCKNTVKHFSKEILAFMEDNPLSAEVLLSYYLKNHEKDIEFLYFPSELSNDKKILILDKYISSNLCNSNYLKLIFQSNSTNNLSLPDRLKLKAKRKYDEEMKNSFKNSEGLVYSVQVSFSDNLDKEVEFERGNNLNLSLSYSRKWLKENLDYPTLLNNFIYLFGYTDLQFRSSHVSIESHLGTLENLFRFKGRREYNTGIAFNQIQIVAQLQMTSYCRELEKNDINLETVMKWFFSSYLKDEFNVEGFNFNTSSKNATYLEKCRNLVAEMDSVLKQFKIYCEDGLIDKELLYISTDHMFIKDIPSMLSDKYIYPSGNNYKKISRLLFSDQSMIYYITELSERYNSFYDLLNNEEVYYDMFEEYQKYGIEFLTKHNIIKIDTQKRITLDKEKAIILKELYDYNVASLSYLNKYESVIAELKKIGIVQVSSTLFSKPEQDYYNYLFNKSEFDNGLDLRNRYIHGTQNVKEELNKDDYFIFLRMMILIIIKINEEFCLKYPIDNKSNNF